VCYRLEGRSSVDTQNRTSGAFTLAKVLPTYGITNDCIIAMMQKWYDVKKFN